MRAARAATGFQRIKMQGMNKQRQAVAAAALMGLAAAPASAATTQLTGQYLQVSYESNSVPAEFHDVQLRETPNSWDCSSGACSIVKLPSVSVWFGATSVQPVAVDTLSTYFVFDTSPLVAREVIDPLGHSWGTIEASLGKWSFGVQIDAQTKPADAAFATAYGQFKLTNEYGGQFVPYQKPVGQFDFADSFREKAFVLGLNQTGAVTWGPGNDGVLRYAGAHGQPGFDPFQWFLETKLTSANYALPSITDPRCAALSCMSFAPGTLMVSGYELTLGVVATPSPVPEAGTFGMTLLGGLVVVALRRQCVRAQASAPLRA
jgi:hypothetical protein